jgi:hypothetical protein
MPAVTTTAAKSTVSLNFMAFPPLFFEINGLGNIGVNNKHCRYIAVDIASNATQIKMKIICKTPNKTLIRLFGARLPSPPGCQWCLCCHVTTSFFIVCLAGSFTNLAISRFRVI